MLDELRRRPPEIVVEGRERFRLLELTSGRSFTTGLVEAVVDAASRRPAPTRSRRSSCSAAWSSSPTRHRPARADAPELDFQLAARVDFGVDAKQELLATTSPRRRMERLVGLLEQAIELVRIEQTMRERASRNGKTRTPITAQAPTAD